MLYNKDMCTREKVLSATCQYNVALCSAATPAQFTHIHALDLAPCNISSPCMACLQCTWHTQCHAMSRQLDSGLLAFSADSGGCAGRDAPSSWGGSRAPARDSRDPPKDSRDAPRDGPPRRFGAAARDDRDARRDGPPRDGPSRDGPSRDGPAPFRRTDPPPPARGGSRW